MGLQEVALFDELFSVSHHLRNAEYVIDVFVSCLQLREREGGKGEREGERGRERGREGREGREREGRRMEGREQEGKDRGKKREQVGGYSYSLSCVRGSGG